MDFTENKCGCAMRHNISFMDESSCCGCGACAYICPAKCIEIIENSRGFSLPIVGDGCIECGRCLAICPSLDGGERSKPKLAFACDSADSDNRRKATAGGLFKPLALSVIDDGGSAFGAAFDDQYRVLHIKCRNESELDKCRGSKYVQSSLASNDVYDQLNDALREGGPVLFTGLPCQTSAVRKLFECDDLYTVDLVCHGVASRLAWSKYLQERNLPNIKAISFRNKTYGYHMSTMRIEYENGDVYSKSGRVDPYLRVFFSGIAHRKSCNKCKFKGIARFADITLFDCGRFEELTSLSDDDLGHTCVFINTDKGARLFERTKHLVNSVPIDIENSVKLNGRMIEGCTPAHPDSDSFYSLISEGDFSGAANCYVPVTTIDYLVEYSKGFLQRIGVLGWMKKNKTRLVHSWRKA